MTHAPRGDGQRDPWRRAGPRPALAQGDREGGRLGLPQSGGPLDVRRSPASVRPPEGQSRVLRGARLLVVLPPALLLAIELLLGLIRPEVRRGAHVVFLGALVGLIAAQALKKSIDASDTLLIALSALVGAAVAALWARAEPVQIGR